MHWLSWFRPRGLLESVSANQDDFFESVGLLELIIALIVLKLLCCGGLDVLGMCVEGRFRAEL